MNIIELVDIKTTPDIVHEYAPALKAENTPLVIDNGSYKCRVGWSNSSAPLLEFRNLIAKPRKDRKKDGSEVVANPAIQIGNDIVNIETLRLQLKTQFDRNVVTHFQNQEQILDYIFVHLNIDNEGSVPHPILFTEPLANPNYCRQQLNELFFECYGVPGICYGIDSMFSWLRNTKCSDALIISFGYHTTHVIPVLDGQLQADRVRRLNIGGYHIITFLFRLMQMKYPVHVNAITISRMETLMQQHSTIAVDYMEALRNWADSDYYMDNVKKIQLPYTAPVQNTAVSTEQKIEKRKELARRLVETNARRAREKQIEDEEQLEILQNIRSLHESGDVLEFKEALKDNQLADLQELDKLISSASTRIKKNIQRLQAPAEVTNAPSNTSTKEKIPKPPEDISKEDWVSTVKTKRSDILRAKQLRKTRRQELAKRHTAAAQERMRIISQLARNEKGTDEFGKDDNDWNVYKVINRDNDSDSETENEKLLEYESILRHHDPSFEEPAADSTNQTGPENYQLHVGVECIRAPELLFQPSMIGSSEAGLAELINYVLKLFVPDEQMRLANNVFLTGGCAQFPGLKERLSKELLEMRPFETPHKIFEAQSPQLDAWLGAVDFANSKSFQKTLTTRQEYEEFGSEYFQTHRASNLYYPTPKQTPI